MPTFVSPSADRSARETSHVRVRVRVRVTVRVRVLTILVVYFSQKRIVKSSMRL